MRDTLIALTLFACTQLGGCRLLGIEPMSCEDDVPSTCPAGLHCVEGLCIEGHADAGSAFDGGETPSAELLLQDQPGVMLMTQRDDGALFWATSGGGGCIRRLLETEVEDVFCEEGTREIAGLALANGRVFWLSHDPDDTSAGALRALVDTAPRGGETSPVTLDQNLSLRSLEQGGPSLLSARHDSTSGQVAVAYVADVTVSSPVRRLLLTGDTINSTVNYRGLGTGRSPAAIALTADDLFFVEDDPETYASLQCRNDHAEDVDGMYDMTLDEGTYAGRPEGQGWAAATFDGRVWVSTRDGASGGGILHSNGGRDGAWLRVELVQLLADPGDSLKYASGLGIDDNFIYYVTAGGGDATAKLFKLSLSGEASPEPLLELDAAGGALLLTETHVLWSEPSSGKIMQLAR